MRILKKIFSYLFLLTFIFYVSVYLSKSYVFFKYGKFSFTIDGVGSGPYEIVAETLAFITIVVIGIVGGKSTDGIS